MVTLEAAAAAAALRPFHMVQRRFALELSVRSCKAIKKRFRLRTGGIARELAHNVVAVAI